MARLTQWCLNTLGFRTHVVHCSRAYRNSTCTCSRTGGRLGCHAVHEKLLEDGHSAVHSKNRADFLTRHQLRLANEGFELALEIFRQEIVGRERLET